MDVFPPGGACKRVDDLSIKEEVRGREGRKLVDSRRGAGGRGRESTDVKVSAH